MVMAHAHGGATAALVKVIVGVIQPVLTDWAEHVHLQRVLERFRLVLDPRRNVEHFAFADRDLFSTNQEAERALQDVGHLLAFVRVVRDQTAALQVNLREHLALAGNDLPREHFGHFFECDFVPSMQANRLGAHGGRAYTKEPGCYNSRLDEGRPQRP